MLRNEILDGMDTLRRPQNEMSVTSECQCGWGDVGCDTAMVGVVGCIVGAIVSVTINRTSCKLFTVILVVLRVVGSISIQQVDLGPDERRDLSPVVGSQDLAVRD